jgi:large subunit ribosomal protein L7A
VITVVDRLYCKKVIGIKQSTKSLKDGNGKELLVAKDADQSMVESVITIAKQQGVEVTYIENMKKLGKLCGIDVGASVTLLLKDS